MDFRNKYLKYKPEITFDIFQEVWDKLISFGYRPFNDSTSIKRYNEFKSFYCFLKTTKDHPMEFSCYCSVADSFSETTVQEILGYDPFVKDDDFVLPEKWCCKITDESIEIFNNWRISMSKHYLQNKIDKTYHYITNNGSCNYTTIGIEITFDQFKKYVLNWNHVCFKPSSKSAFDAQNQPKQLSEQTANNISETIDIAIQTAKVGMLKDALKSFTCDIQHYDHEFLAQMISGKVSKVNKVQISTDNEIKINIIQKQSIKI